MKIVNTNSLELYRANHRSGQPIHDPNFNCRLSTWQASEVQLDDDGTHMGFVVSGHVNIACQSGEFEIQSGMYFSIPGAASIVGTGVGFAATRVGWRGFFQLGGPAEEQGRLRYIDGCSDSLLISPVVVGDPCLNLLYLPPDTQQTEHTHPSCRLGMIISGSGVCKTPDAEYPLEAGLVFNIAADGLHSFHTQSEALRVVAWHPDSDFGPTHHNHPMINRTMIAGVSANAAEG